MLTRWGRVRFLCFPLLFCANLALPAQAGAPQVSGRDSRNPQYQQRQPSMQQPIGPDVNGSPDPFGASMEARRLRMQNDDRHKRLISDTEKLLSLSAELKDQVSKTTKDELSLDVIKKAAEIEKLAHDVKERMRS